MKKIIFASVVASTLLLAETNTVSTEPYVAPPPGTLVTEGGPVSVALLGGMMKHQEDGYDWEFIYGAELSFPCFLSSDFRSQLQILLYDDSHTEVWQISANPHYMFEVSEDTQVGIGPSIGVAHFEIAAKNDYIFTFGIGASVRHDIDKDFFVGAEARYEWPTKADLAGVEYNTNNAKFFFKLGMNF